MNIASNLRHILRPTSCAALIALALAASACAPLVLGGGGGGDDTDANGKGGSTATGQGGSTGTGQVPLGPTTAIGVPYALMPSLPPGGSGVSGSGGGSGIDPSTLYVQIGNFVQACPYTVMPSCQVDLAWQVSVGIPPALQTPGVIALSDARLISTFGESGGSSEGDCFGGGGSFQQGRSES